MDAINFQSARAQLSSGVLPIARTQSVNMPRGIVSEVPAVPPIRSGGEAQGVQPAANRAKIAGRLVAAVVPGGVSFDVASPSSIGQIGSGGASKTASGSAQTQQAPSRAQPLLQMYKHPADKNIAATGVHVGRAIDDD